MNQVEVKKEIDLENLSVEDKWILEKLNNLILTTSIQMDKYEFGIAQKEIYNFVINDFCSNYLEFSKFYLFNKIEESQKHQILMYLLKAILKIMHPFMPFITEEIYSKIGSYKSIMESSYPEQLIFEYNEKEINTIDAIIETIYNVRNVRAEYDLKPKDPIKIFIESSLRFDLNFLKNMTNATKIIVEAKITTDEEVITAIAKNAIIMISKDGLIDSEVEIIKLKSIIEKLEIEINRCQAMLNNDNFISRAKPEKIVLEQNRLTEFEKQINDARSNLSKYL